MSHFSSGFETVAGQAEELKVAPLVGAPIDAGDDVVEGEGLCGAATHAYLRQRGPNTFALAAGKAAAHV